MITLAGSIDASAAALANLQAAMQGAGRSVAALSSGEKVSAAASPAGGAAPATQLDAPAGSQQATGRLLDTTA